MPSELAQSKIIKLLLNDNFENIYFIGSKSLKEEMNSVKNNLFNRWVNINISNDRKCELIDIDKKFINYFLPQEAIRSKNIKEKDYESFFIKNNFTKYDNLVNDNDKDDNEIIKVPAFRLIFNGDCCAFITENFSIEVYNSIFDPSAFDKKSKIPKKDYKNIKIGDIILIRHKTDSDVLDMESISLLKNDSEKFFSIKKETEKIPKIINQCLDSALKNTSKIVEKRLPGLTKSILSVYLKKANYTKGVNNVISLSDLNGGIICPNSLVDLKKIFKACEIICNEYETYVYKYNEKEINEIFNNAKKYKSIRLSAGFSISKKLKNSLKKVKDLEFDGNPLRVDYINREVIFGAETTGKPEGYVVQVNNLEEPRILKEVKQSKTNRLLFL